MKTLINKVWRLHAGLSVEEFADLLQISMGLYYQIQNGTRGDKNHTKVKRKNKALRARLNELLEAV